MPHNSDELIPKMLAVDVLHWDERPGTTLASYTNESISNEPKRVKHSFGRLYGWVFYNPNTTAVFVKFYNFPISEITVGETPVTLTLCIPPATTESPGMYIQNPGLIPFEDFTESISIAVTTGLASSSTEAPASPIHAHIKYK